MKSTSLVASMSPFYRTLIVVAVLLSTGCASTPPVQTALRSKSAFDSAVYSGESAQLAQASPGAEAFRAFYQGGSGFVSLASVRETVEDMATKHCARQDKNVRLLQERTSSPPHILGNFPRVEWLFECAARLATAVSAPSTKLEQLERLKRLLDSGALTKREFDSEKEKILGAQ